MAEAYVWFLAAYACISADVGCSRVWQRGPYIEALDCQAAGHAARAEHDPRVTRLVCEHRKVR